MAIATITHVSVEPQAFEACIEFDPAAPRFTSDEPEATQALVELMPGLLDHACVGDSAPSFGEVVADTELAHLLEHVCVELVALTNRGGDVMVGQTYQESDATAYLRFPCPDDVLMAGALSSAVWLFDWAYESVVQGDTLKPDIEGIVEGLCTLVDAADQIDAQKAAEAEVAEAEATEAETEAQAVEAQAAAEAEPAEAEAGEEAPTPAEEPVEVESMAEPEVAEEAPVEEASIEPATKIAPVPEAVSVDADEQVVELEPSAEQDAAAEPEVEEEPEAVEPEEATEVAAPAESAAPAEPAPAPKSKAKVIEWDEHVPRSKPVR